MSDVDSVDDKRSDGDLAGIAWLPAERRSDAALSRRSGRAAFPGAAMTTRPGGHLFFSILDHVTLILFLVYAAHVVVSPLDGQVVGARRLSDSYGQLINGSYGQLYFIAYLIVRAEFVLGTLRVFLSPLGLIAGLAMLSTAWSIDPVTTLHRAGDLLLCLLLPAVLMRGLGYEACLRVTWFTFAAILLLSVALAVAGNDYGLMGGVHAGLWRGLFDHKNSFGPFAGIVAIFSFLAPPAITRFTWLGRGVGAIALVALVLANSATAIVAIALAAVIMFQIYLCQRARFSATKTFIVMSSCMAAGGAIAAGVTTAALKMLDRNATLTGRTGLWEGALPYTWAHPLGFGYGLGGGEMVLNAARQSSKWYDAPSLHSGYITLAVDLGWPAVVMFAAFLFSRVTMVSGVSGVAGGSGVLGEQSRSDRYLLMAAGLATMNLSLAATESPFGPYLNAALLMVVMFGYAARAARAGGRA